MGFDIEAIKSKEVADKFEKVVYKDHDEWCELHDGYKEENVVAYLRAYMGAFRMCKEQGYDWFKLIDAEECDGGVSGTGEMKFILLKNLEKAIKFLKKHKSKRLASNLDGTYRNEWKYRKPRLKEFMNKCIKWCKNNKKKGIWIDFG